MRNTKFSEDDAYEMFAFVIIVVCAFTLGWLIGATP